MRTDLDPFKDPRVRRAVALVINRPQLGRESCSAAAEIGNDSPFWRGFLSTDRTVAQSGRISPRRDRCCRQPGRRDLKFNLTTWHFLDHTDHAASVQAYARQAGIDVGLEVMDVSKYYDAEPAGADYATTTPWLNRPATLTEYGARGVPNVYVTRCYMSTGDLECVALQEPRSTRRRGVPRRGGVATSEGDEEDGGHPAPGHAGDHGLLHQLRDRELLEGQELRPEGISHIRLAKVSMA